MPAEINSVPSALEFHHFLLFFLHSVHAQGAPDLLQRPFYQLFLAHEFPEAWPNSHQN